MEKVKIKTILGRDLKVGDVLFRSGWGSLEVVEIKAYSGKDYFYAVFKNILGVPLTTRIDMNEELELITSGVMVW